MDVLSIDQWQQQIGQSWTSAWQQISQPRIDAFAELTGDRQFIHIDPARAAATPFGGTIAHGYLTLSLLAAMAEQALPGIADVAMGVNYGFDKIRFLTPVRSGRSVRGKFTLAELVLHAPQQWRMRWQVEVEIDGERKPALVADWLTMVVLAR